MTKKSVTALLLCICLVIGLFGCNSEVKTETEPGISEKNNTVEEENTAETEKTTENKETVYAVEYANKIFDNSYVHTINVEISDEDWADLKANPTQKTKYQVNVTIDGEKINDVAIATKGNTSLSSIATNEDSDRYSFKLTFGKYVDGQTYYGMKKLNLNNIYADATYMKDYISYEIFRAAGVDASLTSYVSLSINGEFFGLYIAIENVDESYLGRTTDGEGELYKPENDMLGNMGNMDGNDFEMPENMQMPDGTSMPDMTNMQNGMQMPNNNGGNTTPEGTAPTNQQVAPDGTTVPDMTNMQNDMQIPEGTTMPDMNNLPEGIELPDGFEMPEGMEIPGDFGGMMGFGSSTGGAGLQYTDDEISSYPDIFDNSETDSDEEAQKRVIAALKGLSEGENLENYLDTESVIRYFVAHNFVMNYDSYTGTMLHNYYLYENDGKLSMLPWDYNLAFGAFMMSGDSSANSIINYDIDNPLSGSATDSRPMWSWIADNEEYLSQYHEIYNELLTNYFESGEFEVEITRVYEMIRPYVENDPSAFYTLEEFDIAYENLKSFCKLRAESIRKQLNGEEANVDASSVDISAMGSQSQAKGDAFGFDFDTNNFDFGNFNPFGNNANTNIPQGNNGNQPQDAGNGQNG